LGRGAFIGSLKKRERLGKNTESLLNSGLQFASRAFSALLLRRH
jgi:hypothetical protein